ncbi:MAG: Mpo1-like protein [Myxococcota bacterium]
MKTLTEHLCQYAAYHRDRRNVATHFVGIPMIVVGSATLLSRPSLALLGVGITPAMLVVLGSILFYLRLDLRYGTAMAVFFGGALFPASWLASQSTGLWLAGGLGLFAVGWVIQFIGHIFEGRKPAFVDDLVGLLIGPLFITAEAGFMLGLRREVEAMVGEGARSPGAAQA